MSPIFLFIILLQPERSQVFFFFMNTFDLLDIPCGAEKLKEF